MALHCVLSGISWLTTADARCIAWWCWQRGKACSGRIPEKLSTKSSQGSNGVYRTRWWGHRFVHVWYHLAALAALSSDWISFIFHVYTRHNRNHSKAKFIRMLIGLLSLNQLNESQYCFSFPIYFIRWTQNEKCSIILWIKTLCELWSLPRRSNQEHNKRHIKTHCV